MYREGRIRGSAGILYLRMAGNAQTKPDEHAQLPDVARTGKVQHIGRKSLNEIKEILSGLGLTFGMKFDAQGRLVSPAGTPAMLGAGSGDDLIDEDLPEEDDDDIEDDIAPPVE